MHGTSCEEGSAKTGFTGVGFGNRQTRVPTGRGSPMGWRELAVWAAQWGLADVEIAG